MSFFMTQSLLAVIMPGDTRASHSLVRGFFHSLPRDIEALLHSTGYVGNLQEYAGSTASVLDKAERRFIVLQAPSLRNLNDSYFTNTQGAALVPISGGLTVSRMFKRADSGWESVPHKGETSSLPYEHSSVEEALALYKKLSSQNFGRMLEDAIEKDPAVSKIFTKRKRRFWLVGHRAGEKFLLPTQVFVGLGTVDGDYLISASGQLSRHFVDKH